MGLVGERHESAAKVQVLQPAEARFGDRFRALCGGAFELGTQIILLQLLAFLECRVKRDHEKVPAIVCSGLSPKIFLQVGDGGLAPKFPVTAVDLSADRRPEASDNQRNDAAQRPGMPHTVPPRIVASRLRCRRKPAECRGRCAGGTVPAAQRPIVASAADGRKSRTLSPRRTAKSDAKGSGPCFRSKRPAEDYLADELASPVKHEYQPNDDILPDFRCKVAEFFRLPGQA